MNTKPQSKSNGTGAFIPDEQGTENPLLIYSMWDGYVKKGRTPTTRSSAAMPLR